MNISKYTMNIFFNLRNKNLQCFKIRIKIKKKERERKRNEQRSKEPYWTGPVAPKILYAAECGKWAPNPRGWCIQGWPILTKHRGFLFIFSSFLFFLYVSPFSLFFSLSFLQILLIFKKSIFFTKLFGISKIVCVFPKLSNSVF